MNTSPHEGQDTPTNGTSVPALVPCPLDEHTKEHFAAVAEKIRQMEFRIASLEIHRDRLEHGLREAGKFVFESPMSKLMLASIPKDKQIKLKEFFDVGKPANEKTR